MLNPFLQWDSVHCRNNYFSAAFSLHIFPLLIAFGVYVPMKGKKWVLNHLSPLFHISHLPLPEIVIVKVITNSHFVFTNVVKQHLHATFILLSSLMG